MLVREANLMLVQMTDQLVESPLEPIAGTVEGCLYVVRLRLLLELLQLHDLPFILNPEVIVVQAGKLLRCFVLLVKIA
jgi:hypothetical protein